MRIATPQDLYSFGTVTDRPLFRRYRRYCLSEQSVQTALWSIGVQEGILMPHRRRLRSEWTAGQIHRSCRHYGSTQRRCPEITGNSDVMGKATK